jgi:hypothetical protein
MTARARALTVLAAFAVVVAVVVAGVIVAADSHSATPPTTTVPPATAAATSAAAAATTTIVEPSAVTGTGPSSFVTQPAPGPVQVLVTHLACVGYAGEGWRVTYRISNQGRTRTGAVIAQVDADGPVQVLAPTLTLRPGEHLDATQTVVGSGDAVQVTWANPTRPVRSFPLETPTCPTDPADLRQAHQAPTST